VYLFIVPTESRPVFDSYELPLPRRREGSAAALSFIAHLTIAIVVLWRGAALFQAGGGGGTGPRGGGGGGGRPAISWFALPAVSTPEQHAMPPAPAVTVPTAAVPLPEPVRLEVPPPAFEITPPAAVGTGAGTAGGAGQGPGTGGGQGSGTGTGVGSDTGPGTGGDPNAIRLAQVKGLIIPPDCARGSITARFWISASGVVSRVEVDPLPKSSDCRNELLTKLKGYKFSPATTPDGVPVASVYQIQLHH
jgi:hypothetical protein